MKKILTIAALATIVLVGCGPKDPAKDWKNATMEELSKLPEAKQKEIETQITPADSTALMAGAMKYAMDTNALKKKTMGELIKEGQDEMAKSK
ncbi:MAG: entry exclusion lipoprotein TrbK [Candidatus Kapaibacterium sp.]